MTVKIDPKLEKHIRAIADDNGISIRTYVNELIEIGLKSEGVEIINQEQSDQ